jgi:hypothetical protein
MLKQGQSIQMHPPKEEQSVSTDYLQVVEQVGIKAKGLTMPLTKQN